MLLWDSKNRLKDKSQVIICNSIAAVLLKSEIELLNLYSYSKVNFAIGKMIKVRLLC